MLGEEACGSSLVGELQQQPDTGQVAAFVGDLEGGLWASVAVRVDSPAG